MDRARLMAIMERVGLDSTTVDVGALSDDSSEDTEKNVRKNVRKNESRQQGGRRVRSYIEDKGGKGKMKVKAKGSRASDAAIQEAIARIDAELDATKRRSRMDTPSSSALFDDDDDSMSTLSDTPNRGGSSKYQKLLDQFVVCQRDKEAAIVEMQRQKDASKAAVDALRARHEAEARDLRRAAESQSSIVADLRAQLASAKSAFDGALTISPALHDALRRKPRETLSLKEHVQMRFFQETEAYRDAERALRKQMEERTGALAGARARVRELEATAGSSDRVLQRKTAGLERELSAALEEVEALKRRLAAARRESEKYRDDAMRSGEIAARLADSERELAGALKRCDSLAAAAADATKSVATRDDDAKSALQRAELLRVDKAYLSKELGEAQGRERELTAKIERLEEKVRAAERARDGAVAEQLSRSEKGRAGYEKRLQRDLDQFKLQQQKHLADIKEAHRLSMARDIASMREQRDIAHADVERLEASTRELKSRVDELQLELVRCQADAAEKQTELRGALKMKSFELERVALTCDERMRAADAHEIENERLRAKLDALRSDFQQLDLSKGKALAEMRAKLETERSKVRTYETLELELDAAIVAQEPGTQPQDETGGDLLRMVPTLARRRVQQSVALAQQIVQLEREIDAFRVETTRLQRENDALKASLERSKATLGQLTKPQAYVVETLQSREREIDVMRAEIERLRAENVKRQDDCARAIAEREEIKVDLRHLMDQRQDIMETFGAAFAGTAADISKDDDEKDGGEEQVGGVVDSTSRTTTQKTMTNSEKNSKDPEDRPDMFSAADASTATVDATSHSSCSSAYAGATFTLHRHDTQGIPLPRWYTRLRPVKR